MFKRNLWKIASTVVIAAWAIFALIPIQDVPFAQYAKDHAEAKKTEFDGLLTQARARWKSGAAPSEIVALKQIGNEEKIDLSQFFPQLKLEDSLKNVSKRNEILVNELFLRSRARLQMGLDLQGGIGITLQAQLDDKGIGKGDADAARQKKLSKAIEIITSRINSSGVVEPLIRAIGEDRIEVQMPGASTKENPDLLQELVKPAKLDFRRVYSQATPDTSSDVPPGYEAKTMDIEDRNGQDRVEELYVKRIPDMTGEMIANSSARIDSYGKYYVSMQFTDAGRKRFAELTRDIAAEQQTTGRLGRLAILLDGTLVEAPTVKEEIDSSAAEITGNFTDRSAINLANDLDNPLDVPLVVKEQYEVSPTLAQDAISSGVRASIIGLVVVALFMIAFYNKGGLVAVGTLLVNLVIIVGIMANIGATMTLPGLAGIVLTIGMAVDANILIFERMREELAAGKTLSNSNQFGYTKALMTIIDAHIVQLIICAIMIWLGRGPIRGFGVTLAIGVLSTMFTVLITAHLVMELLIDGGWIKKYRMGHLIKAIHVDFIRYGLPAFTSSWTIVVLGICVVFYQGQRIFNVDFSGGDVITLQYKEKIDVADIRKTADSLKIPEPNISYESVIGGGGDQLKIETLEGQSVPLVSALQKAYPKAGFVNVGEEHVGASVGREVMLNAAEAIAAAMLIILLYIAFRFEFGFGVGAMVSIAHDLLMTIGIFVLTGHKFSAPMVAAILCIAGYSINETVVVFDRIREELKINPTGSLREIINTAINKVFARTIMTSSTTFLAALSLYVFGGGVLKDISFTFLIGIVTSTFSAIFQAAQVFYWWHKGDRKHVEAHSDVAPKYEWTGSSKASR